MVLVGALETREFDTLLRSEDLNLRDLLAAGDNPMALATYLWCLRQHRVSLINGSALAHWGATWVRQVLVDGVMSRRKDEEIASAAVAVAALVETESMARMRDTLRANVHNLLTSELGKRSIPLDRPAYGGALLLAATLLHVDEARLLDAARAVTAAFTEALRGGRLFGLGFVVSLLGELHDVDGLAAMRGRLRPLLDDPQTDYEDTVYGLQALWLAGGEVQHDEDAQLAEHVLAVSPAWSYLMAGAETMPPAGDQHSDVTVSPLYRAVLLDVVLRLKANAAARTMARIEARYAGDRGVTSLAFVSLALGLFLPSLLLVWYLIPRAAHAYRYWMLQDYKPVYASSAGGALLAAAVLAYLLPYALLSIARLFPLLIVRAVQSDQRIRDVLRDCAVDVFRIWAALVIAALAFGVLSSILAPGVQHLLGSRLAEDWPWS